MEETVLNYSHVNIYMSKGLVLSDVNLEMKQGEFIYLIGKTGAGKTSLIKTIYGEVPVKEGEASVCATIWDCPLIKASWVSRRSSGSRPA